MMWMYDVYTMLNDGNLFHFRIGVLSIEDVFPHEEVIEDSLKKLISSIRRSKVLLHPIIVDEDSGVILDGMHRYYAFKEMEFDYIGACLIDYKSPYVAVRNWYRSLSLQHTVDRLSSMISRSFKSFELEEVDYDDFQKVLEQNETIAVLLYKSKGRLGMLQIRSKYG
ncbi:MAG: ParB N-terminal domain-containing protein, partial [Candidatus Odinarchaeota archaeon]|nr:ParB N-terminal domain-containing protein [Candidatus Odinarchaeota archaeon]